METLLGIVFSVGVVIVLVYLLCRSADKEQERCAIERERQEKRTHNFLLVNPDPCWVCEITPAKEYLIYPQEEIPEDVEILPILRRGLELFLAKYSIRNFSAEWERFDLFVLDPSKEHLRYRNHLRLRVFVSVNDSQGD